MRRLKRSEEIRRYIALLLVLALAGCNAPASIKTPAGRTAYTADQIVLRVGELQGAAIQAEQTGGLPATIARPIVETTVALNKILRDTPSGWQVTVQHAWADLKPKIPAQYRDSPALAAVWAAVDIAILSLGGTP